MRAEEKKAIHTEYSHLVNMPSTHLRAWLDSEESRGVGMTFGGEKVTGGGQPESVGHHMGERILAIGAKKQADLSDENFADMRKVVGYIHRHLAQRPEGDATGTRWRKSLMNWGARPEMTTQWRKAVLVPRTLPRFAAHH